MKLVIDVANDMLKRVDSLSNAVDALPQASESEELERVKRELSEARLALLELTAEEHGDIDDGPELATFKKAFAAALADVDRPTLLVGYSTPEAFSANTEPQRYAMAQVLIERMSTSDRSFEPDPLWLALIQNNGALK